MAHFVENSTGTELLNLDHVVTAELTTVSGLKIYRCHALDGSLIGTVSAGALFEGARHVIANRTGAVVLQFQLTEDGDSVTNCSEPIIAWRVDSEEGWPEPVMLDGSPDDYNNVWCVAWPMGDETWRYIFPGTVSCATEEAANAHAREIYRLKDKAVRRTKPVTS
jgi:hypothetical protein